MSNFPTKITLENKDKSDKTSRCKEFFDFFKILVKHMYTQDKKSIDLNKVLDVVITRLVEHVSSEKGGASYQNSDLILQCYLDSAYELIAKYIEAHTYDEFVSLI